MTAWLVTFNDLSVEQQAAAGGKGGSLARLYQAGFPVPDGFVIRPDAFRGEELDPLAWEQVQAHLQRLRSNDPQVAFAVRSSAMSEDSQQASFAGEFESVLNVKTDEQVQAAVLQVHGSRQSERVRAYSQARGFDGEQQVAVVIQELVRAGRSGVLFTADPISGRRDHAMITAAWGLGEAVVSGTVTPDTLIVGKANLKVINRTTADKQVQTVLDELRTVQQPVPEGKRRAPVLSDAEAAHLVEVGMRIEDLFGKPMDIEWALADGQLAILQARPITSLPQPEPAVPVKWRLPQGAYLAMRNNIVEMMVDPLTPLFATFGLSAVNACMHRLMDGFFGRRDIMPDEIIITVNDYAYYNGSFSAGQLARILFYSGRAVKYMFRGAVERWTDEGLPRYQSIVQHWQSQPWRQQPASSILAAARELTEAAVDAYLALVSGVIPAAWISEAMFTGVYNALVSRRGDPPASTYLMGFDSKPILAEKSLYDLIGWVKEQPELANFLSETPVEQLADLLAIEQVPSDLGEGLWNTWQQRFKAYLQEFGHSVYNLDFGTPVPADDPQPLLEVCQMYLRGEGKDPYQRQQAAAERRQSATRQVEARLRGLRLKWFQSNLQRAQKYAPLREDGLADMGLAYPLLRQMLLEVGERFVRGGMIPDAESIFWLEKAEVLEAADKLEQGGSLPDCADLVAQRKAERRAARAATPPLALPQIKLFGVELSALKRRRRSGATLKGVAASPGRVSGRACVLNGPQDFDRMEAGAVLVAAITTPAWTPLFARAAAIVTDVGGPLSHGSIVAREYGVPAVLGTGDATRRIRNGQLITVDGTSGEVILSRDGGDSEPLQLASPNGASAS